MTLQTRLPYPGLRAFTREESDLFFGRDGCVDAMVDRFAATRFLAVLGPSGSGKSSLVRTGFQDALDLGLHPSASSRWKVADLHPGGQPMRNLAIALLSTRTWQEPDETDVQLLTDYLEHGPRSILEWVAGGNLEPGTNLLLMVDQFEELFRYGDYAQREAAEAFVALLLESANAPGAPVHVVITMRSEYLGACALIAGLAEQINVGLYLTPRMGREECREAIEGPASVIGFSVQPALVNRLLNDLGSFAPWETGEITEQAERLSRQADQLPVMQHVLNRLYVRASKEANGAPVELKLADYEQIGGLSGALDAHGAEVIEALGAARIPQIEAVFRALVSGTSIALAVRRPCRLSELTELAGGAADDVAAIVQAFCAPGCNFLRTSQRSSDQYDAIVDISHESLIRQWSPLRGWLAKEWRDGAAWSRIVSAEEHYRQGEGGLLTGLDLQNLTVWWESAKPTATWAARHGDRFELASAFLESSQKAEAERASTELHRVARERNRLRIYIAGLAAALLLSTGIGFNSYREWKKATSEATRAKNAEEAAKRAGELARINAEEARARAEESKANAQRSAEFVNRLSDAIGSDDRVGTRDLRSQLMGEFPPYRAEISRQNNEAFKPEDTVLNDYRQAQSFQSTGDARKALDSYREGYEDGLNSIQKLPAGTAPGESLITGFLQNAYYYAWYSTDIGEPEKGRAVLKTTREILGRYTFPNPSTDLLLAQARFENLESRYATEKKQLHTRKAVTLAVRAVDAPNSGLDAKSFAVIMLGNLLIDAPSSEKPKIVSEACKYADEMNESSPMNRRSIRARIECLSFQSGEAKRAKDTKLAREKMQDASNVVNNALRLDPKDPDLLLMAAEIENSLGDMDYTSRQDDAGFKDRMAAKDDLVAALKDHTPIQTNATQLRSIFRGCLRVTFPNKDAELKFYQDIFQAMTKTLDTFPKAPNFAYIAGKASVRIGEILEGKGETLKDKEKEQTFKDAEPFLTKAVMWFDRSGMIVDLSEYSEDFDTYCAAHLQRSLLYVRMNRAKDVLPDALKVRNSCAPAVAKYPWDYYLRTRVIYAAYLQGVALYYSNRYQDAVEPLNFASLWGVQDATTTLAAIYRKGLGVTKDEKKADQLDAVATKQTSAEFSLPVDFGSGYEPTTFHVWQWPQEFTRQFPGIEDQVKLYKEAQGATVNPESVKAIRNIQEIADKSYFSFPQLCTPETYMDASEERYQKLIKEKKPAEAEEFEKQMIAAVDQLVIALHSEPANRAAANMYADQGDHAYATDKPAARRSYVRSAEFAELLPKDNVDDLYARIRSYESIGDVDLDGGKFESAEASFAKADDAAKTSFGLQATVKGIKLLRITSQSHIKSLEQLKKSGDAENVRKNLISAVGTLEEHVHTDEALLEGSNTLLALGVTASDAGDQSTARTDFSRARDLVNQIKEDSPDGAYERFLAFNQLGGAFLRAGSPSDARDAFLKSSTATERYIQFRSATPPRMAKADTREMYQLYGSLSYTRIEAGNFDKGIDAAQAGLKLKPDAEWIEANLAHGLLLTGKRDEAIQHYMHARKGTLNGQTLLEATKDDFETLTKLGFTDPEMPDILVQMAKQ